MSPRVRAGRSEHQRLPSLEIFAPRRLRQSEVSVNPNVRFVVSARQQRPHVTVLIPGLEVTIGLTKGYPTLTRSPQSRRAYQHTSEDCVIKRFCGDSLKREPSRAVQHLIIPAK